MPTWGLDPARYVADSWCDLGYWYFSQTRLPEARAALAHSLRERITARGLKYAAAACLPGPLVRTVRRSLAAPES